MSIFGRKAAVKVLPLPEGFTAEDIRVESSVCTGERTIGFYSRADKRLHCSELVRGSGDIADFYAKYGLKPPSEQCE